MVVGPHLVCMNEDCIDCQRILPGTPGSACRSCGHATRDARRPRTVPERDAVARPRVMDDDVDRIARTVEQLRAVDFDQVRDRILVLALGNKHRHVHASELGSDVAVEQRNAVGAAFRVLLQQHLIRDTGIRMAGADSTHGRRSNIYALTPTGIVAARQTMERLERERDQPPDATQGGLF